MVYFRCHGKTSNFIFDPFTSAKFIHKRCVPLYMVNGKVQLLMGAKTLTHGTSTHNSISRLLVQMPLFLFMCFSPLFMFFFLSCFHVISFVGLVDSVFHDLLLLQNYIQSYWVLLKNVAYIGTRCMSLHGVGPPLAIINLLGKLRFFY